MAIDLAKLAAQGRAHSAARAWETHELDAVYLLSRERALTIREAAEYVRNGVMTVEDYDKAMKINLKPKSLETIHTDALAAVVAETQEKLADKAPKVGSAKHKKK